MYLFIGSPCESEVSTTPLRRPPSATAKSCQPLPSSTPINLKSSTSTTHPPSKASTVPFPPSTPSRRYSYTVTATPQQYRKFSNGTPKYSARLVLANKIIRALNIHRRTAELNQQNGSGYFQSCKLHYRRIARMIIDLVPLCTQVGSQVC